MDEDYRHGFGLLYKLKPEKKKTSSDLEKITTDMAAWWKTFAFSFIEMSSSEHVLRVRRLYKLIFRLHRGMPAELRVLGDNYAREEFKRHKNCNTQEANIFLHGWTDYAINLAKQMKPLQQVKKKKVGKYLDPNLLEHMSDEQLVQLYELHKAATLEADDNSPDNIVKDKK